MMESFWARVEKTDGCWLWRGNIHSVENAGYGRFWRDGRLQYVHRLAYEQLVGPIPAGLTIDHLCRVRHCVNPDHLEAVTRAENVLRGEGTGARYARRTHCKRGHELAIDGRRDRTCRQCIRDYMRAYTPQWRARRKLVAAS